MLLVLVIDFFSFSSSLLRKPSLSLNSLHSQGWPWTSSLLPTLPKYWVYGRVHYAWLMQSTQGLMHVRQQSYNWYIPPVLVKTLKSTLIFEFLKLFPVHLLIWNKKQKERVLKSKWQLFLKKSIQNQLFLKQKENRYKCNQN